MRHISARRFTDAKDSSTSKSQPKILRDHPSNLAHGHGLLSILPLVTAAAAQNPRHVPPPFIVM